MTRGDHPLWRAAGTATLITAAVLLLLLSRSEIRKTLLSRPATAPTLAVAIWLISFAGVWWRVRRG